MVGDLTSGLSLIELYGNSEVNSVSKFAKLIQQIDVNNLVQKYKELMALAVALTTQCPYCLEIHKKHAVDAGATQEELAETTFVAAALRAGAAVTHGTHLMD